jgi:hypothetical protein
VTIFKYPLEMTDKQIVKMPRGSSPLSVLNQRESLVLYAAVPDPETGTEDRVIYVKGTGHTADDLPLKGCRFLGTVAFLDAALVFHVFVAEPK